VYKRQVHAGDLVVGDGDGVVVIPQAQAESVVTAGIRREKEEAEICKRLLAGETTMAVYGWN
jgi:4-hydroxy-4-methyl-2-oxoglutarate aldolase